MLTSALPLFFLQARFVASPRSVQSSMEQHTQPTAAAAGAASSSSPCMSSTTTTPRQRRTTLHSFPFLVLLVALLASTASASLPAASSPRTRVAALFSRGKTPDATTTTTTTSSTSTVTKPFVKGQADSKWDTGRFFRAVVDAQVTQVTEEVNRVRAFITIPPGVFKTDRHPEEVAQQVGKLAVDVGFGYLQSAALGYAFGFGGALMADDMTKKLGARFCGKTFPHKRGLKQAKQFGEFCAAFTAFEGLLHVGRGVNDKWNGIVGSTMVGMFTMRNRPLPMQLKNGLTFGGFNYVISAFGGGKQVDKGEGKSGGKGGEKVKGPVFQMELQAKMRKLEAEAERKKRSSNSNVKK